MTSPRPVQIDYIKLCAMLAGTFSPEALTVYKRIFPERADAVAELLNAASVLLYLDGFAKRIVGFPGGVAVHYSGGFATGASLAEASVNAMMEDPAYKTFIQKTRSLTVPWIGQ